MKFYGKIKLLIRICIVLCVLFDVTVGFCAVEANNNFIVFLCCVFMFAFAISLGFAEITLERQKQKLDDDLHSSFDFIDEIVKKDVSDIDCDSLGPFEKSVQNEKSLILLSSHLKSTKKMVYELKKKDKLLGEILISTVVNRDIEEFLADVMPKIIDVTKSQFIVFYIANKTTNKLEIKSSIGFGKSIYSQFDINMGEGFLGQAALNNKIVVVKGLENDSVYITKTFLGDIKPKNIVVVPVSDADDENNVLGVFAIGSVYEYTKEQVKVLEEIRRYTSYAIANGMFYNKSLRLTNELKFQNQLIQNLNEDLEFKIKERTDSLNNIIDSMEWYFIISVDTEGRIYSISKSAETEFNISKDDFIQKNIADIPRIREYIKDNPSDCINKVLKQGSLYVHNISEDENGKKTKTETEMFLVKNEHKEVTGVTVIMRNISNRARFNLSADSDRKIIDLMLEESAGSIIIVEDDFKISGISKNAEYLLGVNKKEAIDMNVWDIFSEKKKAESFVKEVFDEKKNQIRTLNVSSVKTKINVSIRAKLINEENSKKLIMYL